MLKTNKYAIAFICWMLFVTWASLFSFSDVDLPSFKIPHLDKVVHFTFYFVAFVLGVFFFRERTKGEIQLRKALGSILFGVIVFGIIIEVIQQRFTLSRAGDIFDAISNSIGALVGAWVMRFLFSKKRGLKWK
ncbi:MAG: VanZ family protein [Flavobacteriaceae bacterium]